MFHYHENDIELLMKFYTINHSHYYHLVPLTKRAVSLIIQKYSINEFKRENGIYQIHESIPQGLIQNKPSCSLQKIKDNMPPQIQSSIVTVINFPPGGSHNIHSTKALQFSSDVRMQLCSVICSNCSTKAKCKQDHETISISFQVQHNHILTESSFTRVLLSFQGSECLLQKLLCLFSPPKEVINGDKFVRNHLQLSMLLQVFRIIANNFRFKFKC